MAYTMLDVAVSVRPIDMDLFKVGEKITVDAAWRAGLDPTAQWVTKEIETKMICGVLTCMVSMSRHVQ